MFIVPLSASYTDADCWCELLLLSALLAHTCPALKSHLFNSVCDSSSCPSSTGKFPHGCCSCWAKAFWAKSTCFPHSSIHKSVGSWIGVFLHFLKSPSHRSKGSGQMLPNIWLNSHETHSMKHNSNSFADYISKPLNFLWLLRAPGNIWFRLAVTSTANRAGKHFFEHESCFSRVFRDLCGLLFRQKW